MRQGIKLATMNPENGLIYALLFNNKMLEINPNPSIAFLLRNYGVKARVIKLSPQLITDAITIDFHRGHLLIASATKLLGFNIVKEINPEKFQDDNTLVAHDFAISY